MNLREPPNPYLPPAAAPGGAIAADTDWSAVPGGRILFHVELNEQDVKRLFPSSLPSSVIIAISIVLLLLSLQPVSRGLLLFVVVILSLFLFIRIRLNWSLAIRQSPRLLEPITGYITQQGVFTSSDGCQGYSCWQDIHSIKTTKQAVLFSSENWRLVSMIVPWESFDHPRAAKQALASVMEQRKQLRPISIGDPRLSEDPLDEAMFAPTEPHVAYDGTITFGEIAATGPGKKLRRNVAKWLPICIITMLLGGLAMLGGRMWFLLVGFPMMFFSAAILFMMIRHPSLHRGAERPAFRSRGWFSESGFFLQSRTGQSLREWRSVVRPWHDDAMLCICLPGVSEGWFFFSRNQFASDADFQQACRWTATGLEGEVGSRPLAVGS